MRAVSERMDPSALMPRGMFFPATDSSLAGIYIRACRRLGLCALSQKKWNDPLLDSRNLPPFLDMSTTKVAVRALPRVSAQLSTSARGRGQLARRGVGSAPAGHPDGRAACGVEVAGPWSSRGSREDILLHQVARRLLIRLADSQLKIFRPK